MENIISRLQALTIENLATTPLPVTTLETLEQAFDHLTLNDPGRPSPPSPSPSPTSPDVSATASLPDGDLKRLCVLDERLDFHMKSILLHLDALASPNPSSQDRVQVDLIKERRWLTDSLQELHGLENHHDADIWVLTEAMRGRLAQFAAAINMYIEILQDRSPPQSNSHVVNTGDTILSTLPSQNLTVLFRSVFCYRFAWQAHPNPRRYIECSRSEPLWTRNPDLV